MVRRKYHLARNSSRTAHPAFAALAQIALIVALCLGASVGPAAASAPLPTAITGTVYQDLNASGARETAVGEPGVPGVTVTAYGADGLSCGTATTSSNGSFSLSNTCPGQVRLEFTNLPAWARSGPQGAGSGTSAQFVANNATGVLFGINNPANYSGTAPFLATPWQVPGDNVSSDSFPTRNTLTSMSAAWGGVSADNWVSAWQVGGAPIQLTQAQQTGTLYGLAWQRSANKLFAGAYYKHFAGFGQNGAGDKSGAIYSVAMNPATGDNSAAPVLFADVNTFAGVDVSCPPRPRSAGTGNDQFDIPPLFSDTTIANIGKCSLGDLDISDDDGTLFAMDLKNRQVLRINAGTGAYLGAWPVPTSSLPLASGTCPAADVRPFGMGYHNGELYVGAVCSAESTVSGTANGTPAGLHAYVWKVDNAGAYTLILNYQIIADRFDDMGSGTTWRNWNPWKSTRAQIAANSHPSYLPGNYLHPQPMLADIEFYGNDLILGFRDRFGDQWGSQVPVSGNAIEGIAAGDTKCAAWNGSAYTLEVGAAGSGTTCGGRTASGAGEGDGNTANPTSNGHEFYWGDGDPTGATGEDATEYSMGALAQWAVEPLAQTAVDPPVAFGVGYFDNNGVNRLDNTGGAATKGYVMYDGKMNIGAWGKAAGLGDLEALMDPAPVEIGNRVWNDADGNGRQDPGENGIDGVTVGLWCGANQVGQATTANGGQYYFGGATRRNMYAGPTVGPLTFVNGANENDADQRIDTNAVNITRSFLPLGQFSQSGSNNDPSTVVGVRFAGLNIPAGATITSAYVQFTASNADATTTVNLRVRGEASDNPPAFAATASNISARADTTAFVDWNNVPAWTAGQKDAGTRTPDIASVLQELVSRPGWAAGNAIVITIEDNGSTNADGVFRRAYSWDGAPTDGDPELILSYKLPQLLPANSACEVRVATAQTPLSGLALTPVNSDGVTSNDPLADVRDSDATVSGGNAVIAFTTGAPGENNHGFDLGFAPLRDFGDAPDTAAGTSQGNYNTLAADNGPSHNLVSGLNLGDVSPDADNGSLQNAAADADDTSTTPDDEDGIATLPTITTGTTSLEMTVRATNTTNTVAKLACWVDFNRDGDFLDSGERSDTVVVPAGSGGADYVLAFNGFAAPVAGDSYIRCRLAHDPDQIAAPTGAASSGEVEDFKVVIGQQQRDYGDLPDTATGTGAGNYNTTAADGGAAHVIVQGVYLGAGVDADNGTLQNAAATADDASNTGSADDEDGVTFLTPLMPGTIARVGFQAGAAGCLSGWADYNGDGTLDLLKIAASSPTGAPGANLLDLATTSSFFDIWFDLTAAPANTATGVIYTRFRFTQACQQGGAVATGLATTGEVEDYALASLGDYVWDDANGNGQQDSGEPVRSDITVKLLDASGNPIQDATGADITTTTNAAGKYEFPGLPPGSYRVQFVPPAGYTFTTLNVGDDASDSDADPATGKSDAVTLASGEANMTVDAGLVLQPKDFGDAPDATAGAGAGNYNTRAADDGPSHVIVPNLQLGANAPDADNGTLQNAAADADDTAGTPDDEDGVTTLPTVLTTSTSVPLTVSVLNHTGSSARLACWLDFNGDGDFVDTGEGASATVTSQVGAQTVNLTFSGFATPTGGTTYLRCRLANAAAEVANPTGAANTGEVEDYQLVIQTADYGDLPDTAIGTGAGNYNTTAADNGAAHAIVQGVFLGAGVDADNGTLQNAAATADDASNTGSADDEDGVQFLTPLMPGTLAKVRFQANVAGCLSGWADYNGDGTLDALKIAAGSPTGTAGADLNALATPASFFDVWLDLTAAPANAAAGVIYTRFRFTDECGQGGEAPAGAAASGEVEDYALASLGDYVWVDANKNGRQDDGEAPRADVTVKLLDGSGNPVLDAEGNPITAMTDETGKYEFPGLPPGSYSVQFILPEGVSFTSQDLGSDAGDSDADMVTGKTPAVTLAAGESNPTLDAGLVPLGDIAIGNLVWCDMTPNGIWDSGEPGLDGVTVRLYRPGPDETPYTSDDVLVDTTVTNGAGRYWFLAEAVGEYYLAVEKATLPPSCATASSPGGGGNPDLGDEDVPGGDDGAVGPKPGEVVSGVFTAAIGGQTTADSGNPAGYADNSAYMTVDFGFASEPTAVTISSLRAQVVSPLERLADWLRQRSGR